MDHTLKPTSFPRTCRTCLSLTHTDVKMHPLFAGHADAAEQRPNTGAKTETRTQLASMLRVVAGIQLEPGDGLPVFMCLPCKTLLQAAFAFRQQCAHSNRVLRAIGADKTAVPAEPMAKNSSRPQDRDLYDENIQLKVEKPAVDDDFDEDAPYTGDDDDDDGPAENSETIVDVDPLQIVQTPRKRQRKRTAETSVMPSSVTRKLCRTGKKTEDTDYDKKPFKCLECGMGFMQNGYLQVHLRRHTGEKPYVCRFCQKGFPCKTELNVHERYHTGERMHLCVTCGKKFHRAYNLVGHMRSHTGERPFKCAHCASAFAMRFSLNKHMRIFHKEKLEEAVDADEPEKE